MFASSPIIVAFIIVRNFSELLKLCLDCNTLLIAVVVVVFFFTVLITNTGRICTVFLWLVGMILKAEEN